MSFDLFRPTRPTPLIVEIPHAGTSIPSWLDSAFCATEDDIRRDADLEVDQLFIDASRLGATVITARLSRYVTDLNRFEHEVDQKTVTAWPTELSSHPRGVIWRETGRGKPALRRSLSPQEFSVRLEQGYRPYHQALERVIREMQKRFGFAVMLCAHSMPSAPAAGQNTVGVPARADIVPGTRGRESAAGEVIDIVVGHFRNAGLSVRVDDPYRGGATTVRWGRPNENIHVVQLEINRKLYLNEDTLTRRTSGFAWTQELCASLVERLTGIEPSLLGMVSQG